MATFFRLNVVKIEQTLTAVGVTLFDRERSHSPNRFLLSDLWRSAWSALRTWHGQNLQAREAESKGNLKIDTNPRLRS